MSIFSRELFRKVVSVFLSVPLVLLFLLAGYINLKLYDTPELDIVVNDTINKDLLKELHSLKHALINKVDEEMQAVYPEGFVFINVLYGLSWANLIRDKSPDAEIFIEGMDEIEASIVKVISAKGQETFEEDLTIPYGAFYTGWSSYLIAKKLSLQSPELRNDADVRYFKAQCKEVAEAIDNDIYPVSYYNGAWPADVTICVASLVLHDKLFEPTYSTLVSQWLKAVKGRLDSNGLIPHSVHSINKTISEESRGSSQSLMLIFLKEIDESFAEQQFQIYKDRFLDSSFGLIGIREYPKGITGYGDVDSGPLFFDLGSAATIVGMPALGLFDATAESNAIKGQIEAFGFPIWNQDQKSYLFGTIPMADAFIAWGHSFQNKKQVKHTSFWIFHLYSALGIVLILLLFYLVWRKDTRTSKHNLIIPW